MTLKVTKEGITARIAKEEYARWGDSTMTKCVLTLENGFLVSGESACVDPTAFDEEFGRQLAYADAFRKIWDLEAYLLMEDAFRANRAAANALEAVLDGLFGAGYAKVYL